MRKTPWVLGAMALGGAVVIGVLFFQQGVNPPEATATPPPAATAAPTPAPLPPPAATASPAAPPTAAPAPPPLLPEVSGAVDLGAGAAITLAPGWVGARQPAAAALGLAGGETTPLLAAWQGADAFADAPLRLTILRAPRGGLPLATYLADLAALVAAAPEVQLTGQAITDTLRSDGLPAGLVTFTQAAPLAAGAQAVLIEPDGANLLLLTLVAADAEPAAAAEALRAAVRSLTFAAE